MLTRAFYSCAVLCSREPNFLSPLNEKLSQYRTLSEDCSMIHWAMKGRDWEREGEKDLEKGKEREKESVGGAHWISCLIFVWDSQSGAAAAPMMYYKRLIAAMHHAAPLHWWHVTVIHHQSIAQQEQESWKLNSSINFSTVPPKIVVNFFSALLKI